MEDTVPEMTPAKPTRARNRPGRVSLEISDALATKLLQRSDRQALIEKAILKNPEDCASIQDRSRQLLGMLDRRPTRQRLERLNVIKEDAPFVAASLQATREKLKRANQAIGLSNWLSHRPQKETLMSRCIIVDEHEAAKISTARSILESQLSKRMDRKSLVSKHIIEEVQEESMSVSHPKLVQSTVDLNIKQICSSWAHSVFLDDEGIVYTVGNGDHGHLGHGDTRSLTAAKAIECLRKRGKVTRISSGMSHNAAIVEGGALYVWGEGQWGRLGLGDNEHRLEPICVEALAQRKIVDVACGGYHTIAVDDDGNVFAFGWNKGGRLGIGSVKKLMNSDEPQCLPNFCDDNDKVVRVFAGTMASAALTQSGALYTWGLGSYGLLGHGNEDSFDSPKRVSQLAHTRITDVSIGEYHMLVCTSDGELFSWGRNDYSQLGHGDSAASAVCEPGQVLNTIQGTITSISCGKQYSSATAGGNVYCWGRGSTHLLGFDSMSDISCPRRVDALTDEVVVCSSASWAHTLALTDAGNVYAWGPRSRQQLAESNP